TVTRGRCQGGDHVRNLRARLIDARVTLLARLGSNQLARREAGRAVAALDEAFRLDPARQGLAEELVKALDAAGHRARAADVRERYERPCGGSTRRGVPARPGLAEELVKALDAAGHRARAADVRERYERHE